MKTYYIYYWLFKNDEWQDFETEITAIRFEDAYADFKDKYRLSKIQEMKLEAGDILVQKHYSSETLVKVIRVTEKRAFVGGTALDREYEPGSGIKQIGAGKWNTLYFRKATEADIARIQEKEKIRSLKAFIEVAIKSDHTLEDLQVAANALGYKKEQ